MPKGIYERKSRETVTIEKPDEVVIERKEERLKPLPKELQDKVIIEDGRYVLKDDNHPLCKECNHRQDMHHVWRETEHQGIEKDVYGAKREVTWIVKHKKFDVPILPCQHACKCGNYK